MKSTVISIVVSVALILGVIVLGRGGEKTEGESTIVSGPMSVASQIIEIDAKGGYSPQIIQAQAGIPTTLKVSTNGTFDCSSAIAIPDLGYQANLPPTGVTEIEIPPQLAGTNMQGLCQMGMYDFVIYFN